MNYWLDLEKTEQIVWLIGRILRAGEFLIRKPRERLIEKVVQKRLTEERPKLIWDGVVVSSFLILGILSLIYPARES